jgi:nicotinamide-nucleotide amidase
MKETGHTSAAILAVGDEIVLGQKADTNSAWIAARLLESGVPVREHAAVADDLSQHEEALRRLCARHALVVCTGGLGPTPDDLTRAALARVLGDDLVEDEAALRAIAALMARRGAALADNQRAQALRPRSARTIENHNGTAPGIAAGVLIDGNACDVFCLPGPPREMRPMFERAVLPALRPPPGRTVLTRTLHCLAIGEGDLARRLGPMMDRDRMPLVGTTASGGVVSIRIRYEGARDGAEQAVRAARDEAAARAGPFLFGEEEDTIQSVVLRLLRERSHRLVVAESCTGGGLGALFTETPGASVVFPGGWITYEDGMKSAALAVPPALLERHGAVSEPVARAMAAGALRACPPAPAAPPGAQRHALAVTGVAGPGGGTDAAPVGTVFIALDSAPEGPGPAPPAEVRRFRITGDRADIRSRAARLALAMLRWRLIGAAVPAALWQIPHEG